jgi:hypothetical protein
MRDTIGVLLNKEALQPSNFYLSGVAEAFLNIDSVMCGFV